MTAKLRRPGTASRRSSTLQLDQQYEAQVGLKRQLSKDAAPAKIPASSDLTSTMLEILQLNLYREHFDAIVEGRKRVEYRRRTAFWRGRLEGRKYDFVRFRNGYSPKAPEMLVELRGIRRYGTNRRGYYAISLGRIIKLQHWRQPARGR